MIGILSWTLGPCTGNCEVVHFTGKAFDPGGQVNETPANADTALTLYTGANVYTRINYIQFLTDSTKENLIDSIRCVPGANNSIDISY